MATLIERAVAVGINEEQAQATLTLLGESAFEAALKKKEAEQKKVPVDYVEKFKGTYADAYAAAESALATLKKHITDFTTANPKAKLAFDSEQLVKSSKRGGGKQGDSTGKTREKVELTTIAQRYAGCKLSYKGNEAELLADGKVRADGVEYKDPNEWGQKFKEEGKRFGIWFNVIRIDVEGEQVTLAKAHSRAKNTAVAPVAAAEPVESMNGKKK